MSCSKVRFCGTLGQATESDLEFVISRFESYRRSQPRTKGAGADPSKTESLQPKPQALPRCRQWLQRRRTIQSTCICGVGAKMPFEIDDALSFEENLTAFAKSLEADDPKLAAVLAQKLPELLNGRIQQSDVWNALETASREQAT